MYGRIAVATVALTLAKAADDVSAACMATVARMIAADGPISMAPATSDFMSGGATP